MLQVGGKVVDQEGNVRVLKKIFRQGDTGTVIAVLENEPHPLRYNPGKLAPVHEGQAPVPVAKAPRSAPAAPATPVPAVAPPRREIPGLGGFYPNDPFVVPADPSAQKYLVIGFDPETRLVQLGAVDDFAHPTTVEPSTMPIKEFRMLKPLRLGRPVVAQASNGEWLPAIVSRVTPDGHVALRFDADSSRDTVILAPQQIRSTLYFGRGDQVRFGGDWCEVLTDDPTTGTVTLREPDGSESEPIDSRDLLAENSDVYRGQEIVIKNRFGDARPSLISGVKSDVVTIATRGDDPPVYARQELRWALNGTLLRVPSSERARYVEHAIPAPEFTPLAAAPTGAKMKIGDAMTLDGDPQWQVDAFVKRKNGTFWVQIVNDEEVRFLPLESLNN
jgi:hypothetical protein